MPPTVKVTTSNKFENEEIRAYLGVLSSSVVTGTGFFSDVAAAFSDFFGGRSNSYKKQLDSIRNEAMKELEAKARRLGANGLVAVSIDIDQISGKSTQMLMISVTGTAVLLEADGSREDVDQGLKIDALTPSELQLEFRMKQLSENSSNLSLGDIFEEYKDTFEQKPNLNQARVIVRKLFQLTYSPSNHDTDVNKALNYLSCFAPEDIADVVHDEVADINPTYSTRSLLLTIASKLNILDVPRLKSLLNSQDNDVAERALIIGRSDKPSYSAADIDELESLKLFTSERFPIKRELINKKRRIGKDVEIWKCVNGHEVEHDSRFCNQCGMDRRDLSKYLYENFQSELEDKLDKLKLVYQS